MRPQGISRDLEPLSWLDARFCLNSIIVTRHKMQGKEDWCTDWNLAYQGSFEISNIRTSAFSQDELTRTRLTLPPKQLESGENI